MGSLLHAETVSKSFVAGKVRTTVLNRLSLSLEPGELTLLAGPSGCGKSTLLAIVSGLERPDEGWVEAQGVRVWSLSHRELRRFRLHHVGFVFQGFNLFSALNALEQVELPLTYLGLSRSERRRRAEAALDEVGLTSHQHLRPAEMSGGEKQRVAIARALAKEPTLLFADEPTSALDSVNGRIIIDIMHRAARRHGVAVLCATHDPRLLSHADRILRMEDGRLLADERPSPTASNVEDLFS
jgi:putative ABC transport system ATP-binding protein